MPSARIAAAVLALTGLAAPAALAQEKAGGIHDFQPVIAPLPVSNPAIGTGLAVAALGLYQVGDTERPWVTGAAGFYTNSESWGAAIFQEAFLRGDRFRVMGGAGAADLKVDFFGIGEVANNRGRAIPIDVETKGGLVQGLMRVRPNLYAGLHYRVVDVRASFNPSEVPFPELMLREFELRSTTSQLGLAMQYDTRDNEFAPNRGWQVTATVLRSAEAIGSDFDFTRTEFAANRYLKLDDKSVLALRASTCSAGDDAPFYMLCAFGSQSDLRGYTSGEYLDQAMYAVQAEYRRHLFGRFGGVVFGGVGSTARAFDKLSMDDLLPAGGVGLRYRASKDYGVNVRVDYAWGLGSQGVYFSVGEAF